MIRKLSKYVQSKECTVSTHLRSSEGHRERVANEHMQVQRHADHVERHVNRSQARSLSAKYIPTPVASQRYILQVSGICEGQIVTHVLFHPSNVVIQG